MVSGVLLGWKAVDESRLASIAYDESEDALISAATALKLKYHSIGQQYEKVERRMSQAINDVNLDALNEFKGGQPNSFPSLADSLISGPSTGIEFGVTPLPEMDDKSTVATWIETVGRIRKHRDLAISFLNAPNLTVIPDDLVSDAIAAIDDIDIETDELEALILPLAVPHRAFHTASEHQNWSATKRALFFGTALSFFFVGAAVFGRASKNWYDQTQRFQDAILRAQAEESKGYKPVAEVSYKREIGWLALPILLAILLAIGASLLQWWLS